MKYEKCKIVVLVFSLLTAGIAHASDFQQCPFELLVSQTVQGAQPDWSAFNSDKKHPYVGISFSEGSPDKRAILSPSKEKKIKRGILAIWEFPTSVEGYWISCLYAETSATVARKLPSEIQSCEAEYDIRSSPPLVKKWHCDSQTKELFSAPAK